MERLVQRRILSEADIDNLITATEKIVYEETSKFREVSQVEKQLIRYSAVIAMQLMAERIMP